jgi:Tfp pilus assembly protein PilV
LVEILLTVVLISLTITSLVSSMGTVANAGTAQRNSVRADIVLRNYAEATKTAVKACVPGAPYVVTYPPPLPGGFTVTGANGTCPAVDATKTLTLVVTPSSGPPTTMVIKVRTP